MKGGIGLWWMRGKKFEAEGIDDEEEGAFVGWPVTCMEMWDLYKTRR